MSSSCTRLLFPYMLRQAEANGACQFILKSDEKTYRATCCLSVWHYVSLYHLCVVPLPQSMQHISLQVIWSRFQDKLGKAIRVSLFVHLSVSLEKEQGGGGRYQPSLKSAQLCLFLDTGLICLTL